MTDGELLVLVNCIKNRLRENFETIHLSGNLINTIEVRRTTFGFEIDIPAEMYDIPRFEKEGVIVYTGEGSYAQAVDVSGGFSKKHKGYVEKAIQEGINDFIKAKNLKIERISWV
jgi:hypothetical protein